jgi:hypothetical protein
MAGPRLAETAPTAPAGVDVELLDCAGDLVVGRHDGVPACPLHEAVRQRNIEAPL